MTRNLNPLFEVGMIPNDFDFNDKMIAAGQDPNVTLPTNPTVPPPPAPTVTTPPPAPTVTTPPPAPVVASNANPAIPQPAVGPLIPKNANQPAVGIDALTDPAAIPQIKPNKMGPEKDASTGNYPRAKAKPHPQTQNQQPTQEDNSDKFGWGSMYAASAITGLGTKIGKDMLLVNKIVNRYPEPKQLAAILNRMESDRARMIAMKLYTVQDRDQYKTIVRKYIAKGTLGRYIWHTLTGPISTVWNVVSGANNALAPNPDLIGEHV